MILRMTRLCVCLFAFVLLAAALTQRSARAGDYPTRPIALIAPWPPGGAVDTLCRILAAKLSDRARRKVLGDNVMRVYGCEA